MTQYIDKSALVAEIEKRKLYHIDLTEYNSGYKNAIFDILSLIDTLKVKDIDFENSVKGRIDNPLISADFPNIYPDYKELKDYCDKNSIKDEDKVKIIIIKDE